MDFEEYAEKQKRTSPGKGDVVMVALGLTGESGEFADIVKKARYQGHELDREKLIEELGDILWYIFEGARTLGVEPSEIARVNIKKLEKRYPEGFDPNKSINREEYR
jgi:NTP pyrophosphatase (non-canonical NTP hydrolase)